MKKYIIAIIITSLLGVSGCAQMIEEAKQNKIETKARLMECDDVMLNDQYKGNKKADFINQLDHLAVYAMSNKRIKDIKLRTLELSMLPEPDTNEVMSSIIKCEVKQNQETLKIGQSLFNQRKTLTNNKDEKNYLVKAFGEWESLVKNGSGYDKKERYRYDSAMSFYKNN